MADQDRLARLASNTLLATGVVAVYVLLYVYLLPYFFGAALALPFAVLLRWWNSRHPVTPEEVAAAQRTSGAPHQGFLLSRIEVRGVGGGLFALTPILIVLLAALRTPKVLIGFVAIALCLMLVIRFWTPPLRPVLSVTHMGGAVGMFLAAVAVLLLVGQGTVIPFFVATGISGGVAVAFLLLTLRKRRGALSIRRHDL